MTDLHNSFAYETEETIRSIANRYDWNFTDIIFKTVKLRSVSKSEMNRFDLKTELLDHYYE